MSLNNREFHFWKEGGVREREREAGGQASRRAFQQAGIFKVRSGLGDIER
jgi:hypothetical protein